MNSEGILHINSYYIDNHLYSHLLSKLDPHRQQNVYVPIKWDRQPEYEIELPNTSFRFDKCIRASDKYFHFMKINRLYKRLLQSEMHRGVSLVHAHNLFTDGALAYRLNQKFGLPYLVAVRMTDIQLQYKYMYQRRRLAANILNAASRIIFISDTYKDRLFSMMPQGQVSRLADKVEIIPNGVQDIWVDNPYQREATAERECIEVLYVGHIMKRKNVVLLIDALRTLNNSADGLRYRLTVIGGQYDPEPDYFREFKELADAHDWVQYKDRINDPATLMHEFRRADIFAMPSTSELFGLVYIEALSQGVPILYVSGEGISSYFDNREVGAGVEADSVDSIVEGIRKIANTSYSQLHEEAIRFDWRKITKQYLELYSRYE